MNSHVKFMAEGKSDTAVEGQEVRKDERGAECDGTETKRNGRGIMWASEVGKGGKRRCTRNGQSSSSLERREQEKGLEGN